MSLERINDGDDDDQHQALIATLAERSLHTLHGFSLVVSQHARQIAIGAVLLQYDADASRPLLDADDLVRRVRRSSNVRSLQLRKRFLGAPLLCIDVAEHARIAAVIDAVLAHPVSLQLSTALAPVRYRQHMRFSVEQSEALFLQWALPVLDISQARNCYFTASAASTRQSSRCDGVVTTPTPLHLLCDDELWTSAAGKRFAQTLLRSSSSGN